MVQGTSTARAFSVMQELQQLRDKVGGLSEKNRQLAKALTTTKQELTKARAAQTAVFSSKVVEWMDAQHKPIVVRHQATQCDFGELVQDPRAFVEYVHLEPEPPLPPLRSGIAAQASRVPSPIVKNARRVKHGKIIGKSANQDSDDDRRPATSSEDPNATLNSTAIGPDSSTSQGSGKAQAPHLHSKRSPHVSPGSSSQVAAPRRLRRRDASVSYVEPKLNTKLRRGDYYGLGKRTGQQGKTQHHHHHRTSTRRVISEPRRTTSAFVPAPFAQQRSPFRRRTARPVQRVSYAEPKLNTKLRQGDKFTFTT